MKDQKSGWMPPTPRRWYHNVVLVVACVAIGLLILMLALVAFFGLIAGW